MASAIHLPLQEFQAMHLALGLTIAPLQGKASFHRIVVSFQSLSKVLEFWCALVPRPSGARHPGVLLVVPAACVVQVGDEFIRLLNLLISFTQLGQVLLLPVQTLLFFKGNPMGHEASLRADAWGEPGQGFGWQDQPE